MFDSYRTKYDNVRMKREDGILEVALHSGGGPLVFNGHVHDASPAVVAGAVTPLDRPLCFSPTLGAP